MFEDSKVMFGYFSKSKKNYDKKIDSVILSVTKII